MSKPYQLVVFDWEGTLGEDGLSIVLCALSDVAKRMHLGSFDLPAGRQYIASGLATTVKKLFPNASLYQQEELLHEVQKELSLASSQIRIMPGALETIQWLHHAGVDLGIATNKSHQGLMHSLAMSGLDVFFQVTRSASEVPPKPCPQMLEEIMATFAVDAAQTLMIGDSTNDMIMATSIGVDAIGLDFFHTESAELIAAGAVHVCNDYQQLLRYLKEKT